MSPEAQADRESAQIAFVNDITHKAKAGPLLVARFISRQVAGETAKMVPGGIVARDALSDCPEAESGDYTLYDHLERLRYLECEAPEDEMKLLSDVLSTAVPGLEAFVTSERQATLLGKMAYNSFGICIDGGRDNKVGSTTTTSFLLLNDRDSLPPMNVQRMWRRLGPRTVRPNKSARECIWLQPM